MIEDTHRRTYLESRVMQLEVQLYGLQVTYGEAQADPHESPESREPIAKQIQSLEARLNYLGEQLAALPEPPPADDAGDTPPA